MPANEVVLVDAFLSQAQNLRDAPLPESDAFELFAAQVVLWDHQLSDDELETGRVGGGRDGGIDGAFAFLDDQLLDEDSDIFASDFDGSRFRKNARLTLELIQAKSAQGFEETAIDKASSSIGRFLDLSMSNDALKVYYSEQVIARMRLFTDAWTRLSPRSPRIEIRFSYVTRGDSQNVTPAVTQKCQDLESQVRRLVPGATAEVVLIGAKELWKRASTSPEYDLQLRFGDYLSKGASYTGLVNLADYYEFLSDSNGALRSHLFDWNVRDYQGSTNVNNEILKTLDSPHEEDFWWLNNGVTILCAAVTIGGDKTFTLENVQIVNGMQTSHSIHSAIARSGVTSERLRDRSVQVRIFETQDEVTRDRVIRATNSQTKVPDASLHATEEIHRQIEAFFASQNWWYDRRKNFNRNNGRQPDRIISIPFLGQAIMAIGFGRPHDARARPSSLLNNQNDYVSLFNTALPLSTYLWLAQVQRLIDTMLLKPEVASSYERTNLRFHVSVYLVTKLSGRRIHNPAQLNSFTDNPPTFTAQEVREAVNILNLEAQAERHAQSSSIDRIAKGSAFSTKVIEIALGAGSIWEMLQAQNERNHRMQ